MNDLEILNHDFGPLFDVNSSEFVPSASLLAETDSGNSSSDTDSSDLDLEHLLDFEVYPSEDGVKSNSPFSIWGSLDSNADNLSTLMMSNTPTQRCHRETKADDKGTESFYLEWIDALVILKGGRVSEAELYEQMEKANATLYTSITKEFGAIIPLMMKHPQKFKVINDGPFKWSIVSMNVKECEPKRERGTHSQKFKRGDLAHQMPSGPIDERLVDKVIETATSILKEAPKQTLKAVEIANALRANLGVGHLHKIKAHFGGLLTLLQKYPDTFRVRRIPKNDMVSLIVDGHFQMTSATAHEVAGETSETQIQCPALALLTSEKCVPGKAWSSDVTRDLPYVKAIVDILEKNERLYTPGGMTVSKLRGLLRLSLKSKNTIKSVPLKALLRAYSNIFNLSGNNASLCSMV